MLMILEGCDATGKTTLAKLLAETHKAQVIHCTANTPNTFDFFREIAYASQHTNIIADRFCYGQFVYQEEDYRRICSLDNLDKFTDSYTALHVLESQLLCQEVRLIYTYSDTKTITDRMILRGENPAGIGDILKGYNELWKKTLIQPIYFKT